MLANISAIMMSIFRRSGTELERPRVGERARWRGIGLHGLRFLLGGISTTIVSYVVYLLLLPHFPYLVAYAIGYGTGVVWSYFVNTWFVFKRRASLKRGLVFPIVYLAQYLLGSALLVVLVDHLHVPAKIAPLAIIVLTLPVTYILSRWIITARTRGPNEH